VSPVATDLYLQPAAWLLSGPAEQLLASPWGAPAIGAMSLGAVAAGATLGASYDRLTMSARHAAVAAVLLIAVHVPTGTAVHR
jgi:hypothetical protein